MNSQDNPFQALDKALLSSSPAEEKSEVKARRRREKKPAPQTPAKSKKATKTERAKEQVSARPPDRATVRTARRVKVRHGFEFYQDQIFRLRELRRNALLRDEDFSMSQVVRKALDQYLKSIGTPYVRSGSRPGE